MPCKVGVDEQVESDILDCDEKVCDQIGAFLEELQEDPLPGTRQTTKSGFFYQRLECGYFVSWEVLGDWMILMATGDCRGVLVRILGVGREAPA